MNCHLKVTPWITTTGRCPLPASVCAGARCPGRLWHDDDHRCVFAADEPPAQ